MAQPYPSKIITNPNDLTQLSHDWQKSGHKVGLVPTMGALHDGHLSLVDKISEKADKTIVSIFVNPTQFGPHEDYSQYPRTIEDDLTKLSDRQVHAVYLPRVEDIYPVGSDTRIKVGKTGDRWEGAERPGHFNGVATVVTILFNHSAANIAIFGEKDFQQLAVIRQVTRDLSLPIEIMAGAIIREKDGLAMSSRNRYLSSEERTIAGQLNTILKTAIIELHQGTPSIKAEETATQSLLEAGFTKVDYVKFVNSDTLLPIENHAQPIRLIATARLGKIRLLDNMAV